MNKQEYYKSYEYERGLVSQSYCQQTKSQFDGVYTSLNYCNEDKTADTYDLKEDAVDSK